MVQSDELQRTKKTDISNITYISRKRRLLEKTFFLLTTRSFKFSRKGPLWSYLDSNKTEKQMVQTKQILRSKRNQSYLISSTSREKEDYQSRFFTDKGSFKYSGK